MSATTLPPHTTNFCCTCVARDRVIERGLCVVCGQPPNSRPVMCGDCGGEGVIGGVVVSDDLDVPTGFVRCGGCDGRGSFVLP